MDEKLLKLLHDERMITEEQYQRVLQEGEQLSAPAGTILEKLGILSEQALVEFLSKKFRMPVINWNEYAVDQELLALVPDNLAAKYTVFPYALERSKRGGKITLAIADPTDVAAIDDISFRTGCVVKTAVSSARSISQAIQQYYRGQGAAAPGEAASARPDQAFTPTGIEEFDTLLPKLSSSTEFIEEEPDILALLDQEHPATKALVELLNRAVERGASEIHIEPSGQEQRIRLRVAGDLHQSTPISEQIGRDLTIRLRKILSRSDTQKAGKKELAPCMGNFFTSHINGKPLSIFASVYPTPYGEKILLQMAGVAPSRSLEHLGIGEPSLKLLSRILTKPEGLVLLVSPPGQGKTTTLQAILQKFGREEMSLLTVEHPVKTFFSAVKQLSFDPHISYQEWCTLLSYNAPDLLALENVDHPVMAQLAFELASSTFVLASFVARDPADGFCTFLALLLSAMGKGWENLDPFLLEPITGMVSQRLIRTLCPHCKEEVKMSEGEVALLNNLATEEEGKEFPVYTGKGCQECMDTGYKGQTGVFEVIKLDRYLKRFLLQDQPITSFQLRRFLADMPIDPLKRQALQKLREGITSLEEIRRVLS